MDDSSVSSEERVLVAMQTVKAILTKLNESPVLAFSLSLLAGLALTLSIGRSGACSCTSMAVAMALFCPFPDPSRKLGLQVTD